MDILSTLLFTVLIPFVAMVGLVLMNQRLKISLFADQSIILQLGLWIAYLSHFGFKNFLNESLFWVLLLSSIISILLLIKPLKTIASYGYLTVVPLVSTVLMLKPYQELWQQGWVLAIQKYWIVDACLIFVFFALLLRQQARITHDRLKYPKVFMPLLMALLAMSYLMSSIGIVLCGSLSVGQLTGAFALVFAGVGLTALFYDRIEVDVDGVILLFQHGLFLLFGILIYAHFYLTPELPKSFVVLFLSMMMGSLLIFNALISRWGQNGDLLVGRIKYVGQLLGICLVFVVLILGLIFQAEQMRTSLESQGGDGVEYQY